MLKARDYAIAIVTGDTLAAKLVPPPPPEELDLDDEGPELRLPANRVHAGVK